MSNESFDDIFDTEKMICKTEKITMFFDRMKKSDRSEAKVNSKMLANILCNFYTPSEILNKVIVEFLSVEQPHWDVICDIVFCVFQTAVKSSEDVLIREWVLSISTNFSNYECSRSCFYFTTFFISASSNHWLTSTFPFISKPDTNCVNVLCASAAEFYSKLNTEKQKRKMIKILNDAAEKHPNSIFNDVINFIS